MSTPNDLKPGIRTGTQELITMLSTNLLKNVKLEDFVELSRNTQPTQYSGKSHNTKSPRRHSNPPEYGGLESLQDLREELKKQHPDYQHMARCYLHLSSLLRY